MQFGTPEPTIVYLQNNGWNNGRQYSATVLSCNLKRNDVESLLERANNFIIERYRNRPIRWSDVMHKTLLHNESIDADNLGTRFRNHCLIVDDIHFQGGHIYGGQTGDKFLDLPKLTENHLPIGMSKPTRIAMNICTFNDGIHECTIEERLGSINDIRQYQDIILNLQLRQETDEWSQNVHRKKDEIMVTLEKIKANRTFTV